MNVKKLCLWAGLISSIVLLSACNHYVAKANKRVESVLERTEDLYQKSAIPDLPQPIDTVRMENDIWLGNSSVKIMEGDSLPSAMERDDSITYAMTSDMTLQMITQDLSEMTGIPFRLDDLKTENAMPTESLTINYSGKLSGLLNYLSHKFGVWWRYKNGQITFFVKETRIFTVYALPTETQMSASMSGSSMGNSGGGNNGTTSLSTSANLTLWDSIEKGVQQVVGKEGEVSFSHVAGTVTVTASPFIIQRVGSYISNWNEKLSRQVAISVKILQVQVDDENNYGLDLEAVFNSNNIASSFSSPYSIGSSVSGQGAMAGVLSMTLLRPSSKWKNSKALIQAFSTQGKTSLVTSSTVTTLNNKVAPVQVTTSQNYVKEVNVTTNYGSSNNSTDVDMQTDTLNYGFSLEILPRILDHGRLIVMFSMTLSDLLELTSFTSGSTDTSGDDDSDDDDEDEDTDDGESKSTTIQLPKMQMRGFMQEIAMKSGSTLVLTGFEQVSNNLLTSGIGQAKMGLLGGRSYDHQKRDIMVILMTPEILESPMSAESRMRDF